MQKKKKSVAATAAAARAAEDEEPKTDLVTQAILEAIRAGDFEAAQLLSGAVSERDAPAPGKGPVSSAAAAPAVSVAIQRRVRRDREELEAMDPDAGADERLLLRLVGDSLPTAMMLTELTERLTVHLPGLLSEPAAMRAVSAALRDAVALHGAMVHRMQSVLSTVASLRGQRRFLSRRAGSHGL